MLTQATQNHIKEGGGVEGVGGRKYTLPWMSQTAGSMYTITSS